MLVVAAGDEAVFGVAEANGEDAGGAGAVGDRSVDHLPGVAAIVGVEDAGGLAARGEPDVGSVVEDSEAGVAGGEGAFTFEGGWELRGWDRSPGLAVGRDQELEFELPGIVGDRIA